MNEVNATATGRLAPVTSVTASSTSANRGAGAGGKPLAPSPALTPTSATQEAREGKDFQDSVQQAVAHMNEFIQSTQRDLQFSYDIATGDTVVRVLDSATKEVIRQIPDEIFLKLARQLSVDEPVQLLSAQA